MRFSLFRFIRLMVILGILFGCFLLLLPTLASTQWGCNQVVKWINYSIPGQVEIRSLNLQWGKGQVIEGILLKDPTGQSVLGIEKIFSEATLWQLLRKKTHLGFTQIQELNAAIVTDEKGWTNLQRALGIAPSADTPRLFPSTIVLSEVNADLYLFSENKPFSALIKGLTRQENLTGSFEINLVLFDFKGSKWNKLKEEAQHYLSIEGSKKATVEARIINFPVDLIDRLVALKKPNLNGLFRSILGDRLNLTLNKESQEGLTFNLTALTPFMQGDVKGQITQGLFTLKEPAIFLLNLAPESLNSFTHERFELLNPAHLKINFQTLSFPMNFLNSEAKIDLCHFEFKGEASLSATTVDIAALSPLNILNLHFFLESPECQPTMYFQVQGLAQQGKEKPFTIEFESSLPKPNNLSNFFQQVQESLQANLTVSYFPLQLLPFLQRQPELISSLGSRADLQAAIKATGSETWELNLSMQTPQLILSKAHFSVGKNLTLTAPFTLDWTFNPSDLYFFTSSDSLIRAQSYPLQMIVKRLQLPLNCQSKTKVQMEALIQEFQLPNLAPWGTLQAKNINFKIDGSNLTNFSSQFSSQLALLALDGRPSPLFDQVAELNQTAHWKINSEGNLELPSTTLHLQSSIAQVHLEGQMTASQQFNLTKPAVMHYKLTPQASQALSQLGTKEWPWLNQVAHIDLSIEPTSFDFKDFSYLSTRAKGLLSIDHLSLTDHHAHPLPLINNLQFPWILDVPGNLFSINLKANTENGIKSKSGHLSGRIQVEHWLNEQGQYDPLQAIADIEAELTSLPTAFFSQLLTAHDLSPLLGPIIDIEINTHIDSTLQIPGYLDLSVDSADFHARGRLKFNDAITLYEPNKTLEIRYTLSPKNYPYLKKLLNIQNDYQLAAPATLTGNVSHLYLPFKKSKKHQGQLAAQIEINDLLWKDFSDYPIKLEIQAKSEDLNNSLQLAAQASSTSSSPLVIQGTVNQLLTTQGKMNDLQRMEWKVNVQGKHLSPRFIQALFLLNPETKQKLDAWFGEEVEVEAKCQIRDLTGPLQALIKGPQGFAQLDGQLTRGILTLNTPLEGDAQLTPLFSQTFLAKNVPLLSSAIGAEKPLKLTIDPGHFSCPLFPFNLNEVIIGKGILDLGKIYFHNTGDLRSVLQLIRPIPENQLTIWFTPLSFQLQQGQLTLNRLDMLIAHDYTLASWGKIDLMTHQTNLILGLSAQSLHYAFGIQGLDDRYLLQIPLSIDQGKVHLDKKKISGKVGALVAQTQGGSKGKIFGNVLELLVSEKGEAMPPPPTNQPFPWAQEFNSSIPQLQEQSPENSLEQLPSQPQETKEGKKKKHKRHKETYSKEMLKGLQQEASKVLEHIFEQ